MLPIPRRGKMEKGLDRFEGIGGAANTWEKEYENEVR